MTITVDFIPASSTIVAVNYLLLHMTAFGYWIYSYIQISPASKLFFPSVLIDLLLLKAEIKELHPRCPKRQCGETAPAFRT